MVAVRLYSIAEYASIVYILGGIGSRNLPYIDLPKFLSVHTNVFRLQGKVAHFLKNWNIKAKHKRQQMHVCYCYFAF